MEEKSAEAISLALIVELQATLATTLDSIAGNTTEGEVSYLVWGATHVGKLLAGYTQLRNNQMKSASKLMVRPLMEATAKADAAVKKPGFFFQKVRAEHEEEKKLLQEVRKIYDKRREPTHRIGQLLTGLENEWQKFEQNWIKKRPQDAKNKKRYNFDDTLGEIGLGGWYAQYRIYSQFTHGTIRAAAGHFDAMTEPADNLIIAAFTLHILFALKTYAPVTVPDLAPFRRRLNALIT